jgi:imidazolonepropionase-like amidohydrolase
MTNYQCPMTKTKFICKMTGVALAWIPALLFLDAGTVLAESILLRNGIVHTVSGETFTNGEVLIDGDKIKLVLDGKDPESILANKVIDLKGQHLYPGMIDMDSSLGLTEIESVRGTEDTTEVGSYTPDVQSWIAVNPDSELIPVARANGIAYFECAPSGGVVAGMSSVEAVVGWTTEQMAFKRVAALHVYWPEMELDTTPKEKFKDKSKFKSLEDQAKERQKKLKELDEFFLEARAYEKARGAKKNGKTDDLAVNPPYEAMLPAVRGEIPIMVHAYEVRQIKAAVKWAETNKYKIVIAGARDAWMVAGELGAAKVPVVYEATFALPGHDTESYDVCYRQAEVLRKAGVKVVFCGGPGNFWAALAKNTPYFASQAVAFGYPRSEALKGLTLYPAQLLGVDDRLGSITVGKEATVFACDGDILDLRAQVTRMWIAGKEVSLESRHTRLYEKYKNRPKAN